MTEVYVVLEAISSKDLSDNVTNMLRVGWKLQGGVSVATRTGLSGSELNIFAQAMTKGNPFS